MADELPPEGSYHEIADAWWEEFSPTLFDGYQLWWDESKEELIKRLLDLWHR